jgi:hypothetical protein
MSRSNAKSAVFTIVFLLVASANTSISSPLNCLCRHTLQIVICSSPPRPLPSRWPSNTLACVDTWTSAANPMSKVTIYQYILLNTGLNEPRKARRWGTREAIEGLKGAAEILEDTATEVDASVVDSVGFTNLDFDPRSA